MKSSTSDRQWPFWCRVLDRMRESMSTVADVLFAIWIAKLLGWL